MCLLLRDFFSSLWFPLLLLPPMTVVIHLGGMLESRQVTIIRSPIQDSTRTTQPVPAGTTLRLWNAVFVGGWRSRSWDVEEIRRCSMMMMMMRIRCEDRVGSWELTRNNPRPTHAASQPRLSSPLSKWLPWQLQSDQHLASFITPADFAFFFSLSFCFPKGSLEGGTDVTRNTGPHVLPPHLEPSPASSTTQNTTRRDMRSCHFGNDRCLQGWR